MIDLPAVIRESFRKWLQRFLGVDRLDERISDIARHFVTQHDPKTGQPIETLADKHAKQDGKPAPGVIRRGSWDQRRRFMEAKDAAEAMKKVKSA